MRVPVKASDGSLHARWSLPEAVPLHPGNGSLWPGEDTTRLQGRWASNRKVLELYARGLLSSGD